MRQSPSATQDALLSFVDVQPVPAFVQVTRAGGLAALPSDETETANVDASPGTRVAR